MEVIEHLERDTTWKFLLQKILHANGKGVGSSGFGIIKKGGLNELLLNLY